MEFSTHQSEFLLDTARAIIRGTIAGRPVRPPDCYDLDLLRPAGCFVSMHGEGGRLRGCVGRIDASEPLMGALCSAAVSVCSDGRFRSDPVTLAELPLIHLDISALSPPIPVANVLAFDLLNHGIHLTIGNRTGCFLPQVARDTGWTREQLLTRLCTEKMGLPADSWHNPHAKLAVFTTTIIGPEPFEKPAHAGDVCGIDTNAKPIEA